MNLKFNRTCDRKDCHHQALSEPDLLRPAKVYRWVVGDTRRVTVAHPHSPIEGEALCYFHRHFSNHCVEFFGGRR